jgi:hypothetical protein
MYVHHGTYLDHTVLLFIDTITYKTDIAKMKDSLLASGHRIQCMHTKRRNLTFIPIKALAHSDEQGASPPLHHVRHDMLT